MLSVAGPKGLKKRCGKVDTIRRRSIDKSKEKKVIQDTVLAKPNLDNKVSPTEDAGVRSERSVSSHDGGYSATESDVSVSYPTSISDMSAPLQRRYTSTSSTSESSDKPPTPNKTKRTPVESGTLTLGRKKKRAPQPPTPVQLSPKMKTKEVHSIIDDGAQKKTAGKIKGSNTIERSGVKTKEREKKHSKPSFSAIFKANYHGNNLVKEFNGIETTREAIEKVKSSKDIINRTGMPVTMLISDKNVKISIFEGQEPIHQHLITNISCIVYDTDNMCMFGYITSDIENLQRFSHVFSAENKEKASEILTAICKGYKESTKESSSRSQSSSDNKSDKKSSENKETLKKTSKKSTSENVELRKVSFCVS